MRLTKLEKEILDNVLAQVTPERARCYVNAQRATLYSDGKLLYHEGTFNGRFAHAWNSINGKIIDISSSIASVIVVPKEAYALYAGCRTCTVNEVMQNATVKNHGAWDWIGEPVGTILKSDDDTDGQGPKPKPVRKPVSGARRTERQLFGKRK
jgi:hypothetical protein